ncbi:restriction endonuclease subunit S [Paraburkholderia dipogonis]|nr:restriction endonuclease subunit S [Paraburkholderia dipogonis]
MQLKPGYKRTEVGVIPDEWEAGSLALFWGVTDCKHVTARFVSYGIPIASIGEVQSRFVDLRNAKQTTVGYYSLLIEGGRKPQAGDLIMSRNATVGELAQVKEWHPPFAMGQDVCLLRKKSPVHSTDYLQEVFKSSIIAGQLDNSMVGSTFKRVNVEQIRNFQVPMPPPVEQAAISEVLSDVDALISSLGQLITKKRDIKQATMQQLLTGKQRLPGFSGKWVVKRLKDVAPLQRGFDLPTSKLQRGGYPVVYSNGMLNNHSDYRVTGPGVVTGRSGTIGNVTYVEGHYWPHNTALWVTNFKGNDPRFIFYLYKRIGLDRFATGSGVPTLNRNDVHAFEAQIPATKEEQAAIASALSDMDAEIAALKQKQDKTRALKQGMMQELLTGKIRLL